MPETCRPCAFANEAAERITTDAAAVGKQIDVAHDPEVCRGGNCGCTHGVAEPKSCWACNHLVAAHDVDPDTGFQPCRSVGHPKGIPCAECRRLTSPEHVAAIMKMRNNDDPLLALAFGAFRITYEHVRNQLGESWPAFFTDVFGSAVASALIEYEPAHAAKVRAEVIAEIAAEPPEGVIVRRDDLEVYLNRGTGAGVEREVEALNRLLAAIGEQS